jgi:hypothetical protein
MNDLVEVALNIKRRRKVKRVHEQLHKELE